MLAGYTRRSKLVNFEGPKELVGQIVKVKIIDAKIVFITREFIEVEKDMKGGSIMTTKLYTKDEIVVKSKRNCKHDGKHE